MHSKGLAVTAAFVCLVLGVSTACSGGTDTSQTTRNNLKALWYSNEGGNVTGGITPVTASTTISKQPTGYSVDLSGFTSAGTGAIWNSAASSAAAVATLNSGLDPRTVSVKFDVNEQIDGPSAGGLMGTGVTADINKATVKPDTTMTGSITPDGALGPVGGIPEKIRAAKANGINQVLIPTGQTETWDPRTQAKVNVVELGKQIGVEVREVPSIQQAYPLLVGPPPRVPAADPGPWNPALIAVLTEATNSVIVRLAAAVKALPKNAPASVKKEAASASHAIASAKSLAAKGDITSAYNIASREEQDLRAATAVAAMTHAIAKSGVTAATSAFNMRADQLTTSIESAITTDAQTPTQFTEQLVGLPDALAWGTDAATAVKAAREQVNKAAGSADVLQAAADEIARAEYDSTEYLQVAIKAVKVVGSKPINEIANELAYLASYARFISQAAQANLEYFQSLTAGKRSATDYDVAIATEAANRLNELAKGVQSGDQPATLKAISAAISSFIATSLLIQTVEISTSGTPALSKPGQFNAKTIVEDQRFLEQVNVANTGNETQATYLAAQKADSSYMAWSNQWGRIIALGSSDSPVGDALLQEGLSYQWFANVQGKMLFSILSNNA